MILFPFFIAYPVLLWFMFSLSVSCHTIQYNKYNTTNTIQNNKIQFKYSTKPSSWLLSEHTILFKSSLLQFLQLPNIAFYPSRQNAEEQVIIKLLQCGKQSGYHAKKRNVLNQSYSNYTYTMLTGRWISPMFTPYIEIRDSSYWISDRYESDFGKGIPIQSYKPSS